MTDERTYRSVVTLARDYQFVADFPDVPESVPLLLDEPAPLGSNHGPNAAMLLGAAVGNCLAASLTFCMRKSRVTLEGLGAEVVTHVTRNEEGKFRITGIDIELTPEVSAADAGRLDRCSQLFEEFCMVTQSVRQGIPVTVTVAERERETA